MEESMGSTSMESMLVAPSLLARRWKLPLMTSSPFGCCCCIANLAFISKYGFTGQS
jgi:hypothetical protein